MEKKTRYFVTTDERKLASFYCRSIRHSRNLSQKEIADELDTFTMAINRIERMNSKAPTWLVKELCLMHNQYAASIGTIFDGPPKKDRSNAIPFGDVL
jgi:transcriptional regulator with XRE-family HTH domain